MIKFLSDTPVLICIASIIALIIVIPIGIRKRNRLLVALKEPTTTLWHSVLILLSTLILTLATLRPSTGTEEIKIQEKTIDLMVILDISLSMLVTDVSPSRLEVAKQKILDIIALARTAPRTLRLGITVFSGNSYVYCPLTSDRTVLKSFTDNISVMLTASRGSSISQAVSDAIGDIKRSGNSDGANILLISDGESDDEDRLSVSKEYPIHTLGIGTTEGGTIPLRGGGVLQDQNQQIVISRLMEENLREIAEKSGGSYRRFTIGDGDIREVLDLLSATDSSTDRSSNQTVEQEITSTLLLVLLVLLSFIVLFEKHRPLFIIIFVFCYSVYPHFATAEDSLPDIAQEAASALESENYSKSVELFSSLSKANPQERSYTEGLATSLFREKKYKEAFDAYDALSRAAKNPKEKFEALYNSANALLMDKKYTEAVKRYSEALAVKDLDQRALENKKYAESLLEQFPPTPTPPPTPSQQPSPKAQTPTPTPSPSAEQEQNESEMATPTPTPTAQQNESEQKEVSPDQQQDESKKADEQAGGLLDELEDRPLLLPRLNEKSNPKKRSQLW